MTQPRAELLAANLNAHTGEVVKRSFGEYHKSAVRLTDSQITLHWISNHELKRKPWVRNRVIEISRFTDAESWMYVRSADMVADIGTRRGATIEDVSPNSTWIVVLPWMQKEVSEFPAWTYKEIKLTAKEAIDAGKEMLKPDVIEETSWIKTTKQQPSSYVIIGDLNYSNIDWQMMSSDSGSYAFLKSMQDNFLSQHINFSTHRSGTQPDVVLSSNHDIVLDVEELCHLGSSDHSMVMVTLGGKVSRNVTFEEVSDWRKADLSLLHSELASVDWRQLDNLDTLQSWNFVKNEILKAEEKCVPKKRRRVKCRPLWNGLPEYVQSTEDLNTFKKELDKFLQQKY